MRKLIHNRIKCNVCNDIIESYTVHDFKTCNCGACFVDGGHSYQHVGGDFTNLAVYEGDRDYGNSKTECGIS